MTDDEVKELESKSYKELMRLEKEYLGVIKKYREANTNPCLDVESVYEKVLLLQKDNKHVINIGIDWLDEFMGGFRRSNTYVLAGYPGCGKTTLALNMAWSIAKQGIKTWYYCLELQSNEVFEVIAGHITKNAAITDTDALTAYATMKNTGFRFYEPTSYKPWEERLEEICKTVRAEEIGFVIIDNLSFLTRSLKNTFEVENVASARIKALSQELEIPILLIHHLRKPSDDANEPEPTAHAMRGSGAILADASDAFILHHPLAEKEGQLRNAVGYLLSGKPRWGKGGKRYLRLEGEQRTYYPSNLEAYKFSKKDKREDFNA